MFVTRICLDASKVEITRHFYERLAYYEQLGYEFVPEKHDNGPLHYAAEIPSVAVEIYPPLKNLPQEDIYCFSVKFPEAIKAELISDFGGMEADPHIPTTQTGIATLRDPNGRLVRLFPRLTPKP